MSTPDYSVVIFTPFHSISGTLPSQDQRLSDLLNDTRESAIRLRNAKVSRLNDPGKIVVEHPIAILPKDEIVIAFEPEPRESRAPKRLYSFVRKKPHQIFMVLDGFEVSGVMHTLGSIDPMDIHELITIQKERFLPVTQARVTFASDERYLLKRDAIIVNIHHIHYIAKAEA
jgi:hypothetical protein